MIINLNDKCKVSLTHAGFATLVSAYDEKYLNVVHPNWREEDVEFIMQLWEVMHVFGKKMSLEEEIVFLKNEIEILV